MRLLSNIHADELRFDQTTNDGVDDDHDDDMVRLVKRANETFWIDGTRMLGCVLRQNDKIETMMKNTDMVAAACTNRTQRCPQFSTNEVD